MTLKYRFFLTTTLIFFLFWQLPAQIEWRSVRLPGGKKELAFMPGEVNLIVDSASTALGALPFRYFYHQDDPARSGNRLYALALTRYPERAFSDTLMVSDSISTVGAELLESTVTEAVQQLDGRLLIDQVREERGVPVRYFRINYTGEDGRERAVHTKAFLIRDRFLVLAQVYSFDQDRGAKARKRFFSSLQPEDMIF